MAHIGVQRIAYAGAIAEFGQRVVAEHPALSPMRIEQPMTAASALRGYDRVAAGLTSAGFPDDEVILWITVLDCYAVGAALEIASQPRPRTVPRVDAARPEPAVSDVALERQAAQGYRSTTTLAAGQSARLTVPADCAWTATGLWLSCLPVIAAIVTPFYSYIDPNMSVLLFAGGLGMAAVDGPVNREPKGRPS